MILLVLILVMILGLAIVYKLQWKPILEEEREQKIRYWGISELEKARKKLESKRSKF